MVAVPNRTRSGGAADRGVDFALGFPGDFIGEAGAVAFSGTYDRLGWSATSVPLRDAGAGAAVSGSVICDR